ncbi:uncharacterized protein PF3D7_1120000-like [Argopecten irradians]|uniref:uncharacterized protein PF3D7_1120000-like n=1 Tax=Argopecten irradians TaxID=31199 RepID=UPI0037102EA5
MESGSAHIGSESEVSTTLKQILSEFRSQKIELNELKEQVRGLSQTVVSEVKKLKTETELSWKYEGNKKQNQYNAIKLFNNEIHDTVKQAQWALENGKVDYLKEVLSECEDKLKQRNKLIRIADTSEGGWETVRQYESNPVASDSEDENKIHRAEARAVKRKKDRLKKPGQGKRHTQGVNFNNNGGSSVPMFNWNGQATRGANGFGPVRSGYRMDQPFRMFSGPRSGACYSCGEWNHFRKDCPHIGPNRAGTDQSVGTKK